MTCTDRGTNKKACLMVQYREILSSLKMVLIIMLGHTLHCSKILRDTVWGVQNSAGHRFRGPKHSGRRFRGPKHSGANLPSILALRSFGPLKSVPRGVLEQRKVCPPFSWGHSYGGINIHDIFLICLRFLETTVISEIYTTKRPFLKKKIIHGTAPIRETLTLSTDADGSTKTKINAMILDCFCHVTFITWHITKDTLTHDT